MLLVLLVLLIVVFGYTLRSSSALVRGRSIVFRHYYKSIAKCAVTDFRDGTVVPFE